MVILEEETFKKFGYYPRDLTHKSHKKILVACDDCGKIREARKDGYSDLCKNCVKKLKHLSEETRKKLSEAQEGNKHNFGKHLSEETRKKLSEALKNPSEERREKMRETRKRQKFPKHHTKPELIFENICKEHNLPFHYVGDSSLWIGEGKGLNPDFIEANGKKIVVEIFGDYWHSPLLNTSLRGNATLPYRKKHYKKYGWKAIFIWETDLKREDAEQFVLATLEKEKVI